jgi:hypothetical protein
MRTLQKTTSKLSRREWDRHWKRHLHKRSVMGQVDEPRTKGPAIHDSDFDATAPKHSFDGIPFYDAQVDEAATRWTRSRACRTARKKYESALAEERQMRIAARTLPGKKTKAVVRGVGRGRGRKLKKKQKKDGKVAKLRKEISEKKGKVAKLRKEISSGFGRRKARRNHWSSSDSESDSEEILRKY